MDISNFYRDAHGEHEVQLTLCVAGEFSLAMVDSTALCQDESGSTARVDHRVADASPPGW